MMLLKQGNCRKIVGNHRNFQPADALFPRPVFGKSDQLVGNSLPLTVAQHADGKPGGMLQFGQMTAGNAEITDDPFAFGCHENLFVIIVILNIFLFLFGFFRRFFRRKHQIVAFLDQLFVKLHKLFGIGRSDFSYLHDIPPTD